MNDEHSRRNGTLKVNLGAVAPSMMAEGIGMYTKRKGPVNNSVARYGNVLEGAKKKSKKNIRQAANNVGIALVYRQPYGWFGGGKIEKYHSWRLQDIKLLDDHEE